MGVVGQELSLLTGVGHVVPSIVGVEVARRGVRPAGHQVAVPHVTISCQKQRKSHLETNHTPFFEKSTDCSLGSRHLVGWS